MPKLGNWDLRIKKAVMFHFARPEAFWLLFLLLPLAFWAWSRSRAALRHSLAASLAGLNHGGWWARWLGLLARILVLALIVLALSQPRWPDLQTRIPAESVALQLVLDVSGSMSEQDFAIDGKQVARLEAARKALRLLLVGEDEKHNGLRSEMAGLLTFAARTEQVCPPTLSHNALFRTLDRVQPVGVPPDSATNIGDAMAMGIDLLSRTRPRQKVMVVLSDGEHNVPPDLVPDALKPRQAARLAQGLGIRVYTISVGSKADDAALQAESVMEDVARMTGGSSFRARDTEGLLEICREIDRLEKTRVQSFQYLRWHEAYPWIGAAASCFLSSLLWLEYTRWRRLP